MTARTKVQLDEVTVYAHIERDETHGHSFLNPCKWRWAVTRDRERPAYWILHTLASGCASWRWTATWSAKRAARAQASRIAGRDERDYHRLAYTATWGVDRDADR